MHVQCSNEITITIINMDRKFRGMGSHLTQSPLSWGLPPYQVASWSMQPFGRNRYGPKIGWAAVLLWGRGAGSPSYTMWPGPRPICTPTQFNSTSCNGRRCEHLCPYLYDTIIYVSDITFTDLSPVPVRSAVKSYYTSWSIQNLSKRALTTLTELKSTTWLGKLFHILITRTEK